LACISGGYFAWFSLGTPRLLAWVGVALMVVIVIASIVIAAPINSRFRRLPEG
jgi:membrane protein YdbS with pleckstrin-like domain